MTLEDETTCRFAVDIHAPSGLRWIGSALKLCELPLYAWESGFNGKTILQAEREDGFEWNMDSSNEADMFASGEIQGQPEDARGKLQSLSNALAATGYPHQILLDGPDEEMFCTITYKWDSVYPKGKTDSD